MKKILLMATALFFVAIANAQLLTRKSEPSKGSSDTTWSGLSGQLTRKKVSNGNVLIHTVPGKYDLYASYKSKKVTGYYAINAKGKKIFPTYSASATNCIACITIEGGINYCYDIDCNDLPKQKSKKANVKTAH